MISETPENSMEVFSEKPTFLKLAPSYVPLVLKGLEISVFDNFMLPVVSNSERLFGKYLHFQIIFHSDF